MNYGIGDNLKRYRLINNLSLKQVSSKIGLSTTAISKFEKEILIPNSTRLIEFAKIYNVSVYDLIKGYTTPTMQFNSFRKKCRLTGQKLQSLKEIIQIEVAKYLEILELSGKLNNVSKWKMVSCLNEEQAEVIANGFRIKNLSSIMPIQNLISLLENLGIFVITISNTNRLFDDFDGLSEVINGVPVIVLLDIEDGARQRFTIAHELGHLLLDVEGTPNAEKLCNRFASALLMPKDAMKKEFGIKRQNINFLELAAIKQEYGVSYQAIVYRLKDLNIINESTYRNMFMKINHKFGNKDPNPLTKEVSHHFERLVSKLEAQEVISAKKAAEYLNITIDDYYDKDDNCRY